MSLGSSALERISAGLAELPEEVLEGTAFRAVNLRYQNTPLSAVGSIRTGGRFNAKGAFEALYLSENPDTPLREVAFSASSGGRFEAQPKEPYILFSVRVVLERVVDLSSPESWARLGLEWGDLVAPWRLAQARGELALTQHIGQCLRERGVEALKFVAATDGQINLAVFPANLTTNSSLEIRFEDRVIALLP